MNRIPQPLYFALLDDGRRVLIRDARPISFSGGKFVVHRGVGAPQQWTVTEVSSGCRVSTGETPESAIAAARERIAAVCGEENGFRSYVRRALRRLSPATA